MQQVNDITVLNHIFEHDVEKGSWFSEILRATGSKDKPKVSKILKNLRKADLIETPKRQRQGVKRVLRLTQLGAEIKKLVTDINQYNNSCSEFYYSAHKNLEQNKRPGIHKLEIEKEGKLEIIPTTRWFFNSNELKAKGWTDDEIKSFESWDRGAKFVQRSCSKNIFLCLILRYALIMSGHKPNDKAKEILTKIIVDEIIRQLQSSAYPESLVYFVFGGLFVSVIRDIKSAYCEFHLPSCKFIDKETRALMASLLSLMDTNRNPLQNMLSPEIDRLRKANIGAEGGDLKFDYEELISLYKDAIGKSQND